MSSFIPKQYGLILKKPAANGPNAAKKPAVKSVFADDDDDDGNVAGQSVMAKARADVNKQLMAAQEMKKMDRHLKQAMDEDPNAFAYDEVYEDIQEAKQAQLGAKKDTSGTRAKPKYIATILKNAQAKKLEDDRRMERKYKKEREAEGEMFADKDAYVTEAYKKRLEEIRLAEEAERMREEADGDVTKKKDMSGFYRNLLTRNVAMGAPEKGSAESSGALKEPEGLPLPEGVDIAEGMSAEDRAAAVKARRAGREAAEGSGRRNDDDGSDGHRDKEGGRDRGSRERDTARTKARSDDDGDDAEPRRRRDERIGSEKRDSRPGEDRRRGSSEHREHCERGERREGSAKADERGEKRAPSKDAEAEAGGHDDGAVDKAKFARRNDEDRVAAARAAALARKRAGQTKAALVQAED